MKNFNNVVNILSKIHAELIWLDFFNNLEKTERFNKLYNLFKSNNYVNEDVKNLIEVKITPVHIRFNKFVFEHLIYLLNKNPGYELDSNQEKKNFEELSVHPAMKKYLLTIVVTLLKELRTIVINYEDILVCETKEDLEVLYKKALTKIFNYYEFSGSKIKNEYYKVISMLNNIIKKYDSYEIQDKLVEYDSIYFPIMKYISISDIEEIEVSLQEELTNLTYIQKNENENLKTSSEMNNEEVIKFITNQLDNLKNVKELDADLIREEVYKHLKENLKK